MTTAFDHISSGTPEQDWADAGLDALAPVSASGGRLVVLAAHPDDESLGAGGLIAASAREGAQILIVLATDGEASHPTSSTHSPDELAALRRVEVARAVHAVAPHADVRHLGLPDGQLAHHGDALDTALASALGDGPARLVTPWQGDRHPDHEACATAGARIAARADWIEHWQYPIWLWHWGEPGTDGLPTRLHRFDLEPSDLAAKQRALEAHVSQHAALSDRPGDEPILSEQMLTHFRRPYECFVIGGAPAAEAGYFDALYSEAPDPWGLGVRYYEQRKRDIVLASLPRPRFRRAFEPGCATGVLTERLLERVDEVVAWDFAARAVEQTAARFAAVPPTRVDVRRGQIPQQWPDGSFDLILLSEVGYYCTDLDRLVARTLDTLSADGVVLACHWLHAAEDHPHSASDVHAAFDRALVRDVHHVEADFVLDVWSRAGLSVAAAEGIV